MPKIKSAKKALRQNIRRRARNKIRKKKIKEEIKGFNKLLLENKQDEAKKSLPKLMKTVDKVAKTGYIKKGRASRIKSRLSKKLNKPKK